MTSSTEAPPAGLLQHAFEARGQRQLVEGLAGDAITPEALRTHLTTAQLEDTSPEDTQESDPEPIHSVPPLDAAPPVPEATPEAEPPPEPEATIDPTLVVEPAPDPVAEPDAIDDGMPEPIPLERASTPHTIGVEPNRPAPPVIGSKFNAPEEVIPDDSDVIGPAAAGRDCRAHGADGLAEHALGIHHRCRRHGDDGRSHIVWR